MGQGDSHDGCLCGFEDIDPQQAEVDERLQVIRDLVNPQLPPPAEPRSPTSTSPRPSVVAPEPDISPVIERVVDDASELERLGLGALFSREALGQRRAVAIWSVTELDYGGHGGSFREKPVEVACPPGWATRRKELLDWLAESGLAWTCKKGLKRDSPNQDSWSVCMVEDSFALVGVYDGHGPMGHHVSQFSRKNMIRHFMTNPKRETNTEEALRESFKDVQTAIENALGLNAMDSGTTCTMVHVDLRTAQLTVAHVGDARAAQAWHGSKDGVQPPRLGTAEELTLDHKPNLPEERHRIENATPPGRVIFDGHVNFRVFSAAGMYPGLNMSRALGDITGQREAGLSAVPDTKTVSWRPENGGTDRDQVALLVCTDGVWEFIQSQEAFQIASMARSDDLNHAMNRLALESWDRWTADSEGEVVDDITAVCWKFDTKLFVRH